MEALTTTSLEAGTVRIRLAPAQSRIKVQEVSSRLGAVNNLVALSEATGKRLLYEPDSPVVYQAVRDADLVTSALEAVWDQIYIALGGESRSPSSASLRPQDEFRGLAQEIAELDSHEVGARLPAARRQLDVCHEALSWAIEARTLIDADPEASSDDRQRQINDSVSVALSAEATAMSSLLPRDLARPVIVRLRMNSPLEIVLAIPSSAAATAAVLSKLLDLKARYRARGEFDLAVRVRLERQIAEDEFARDTLARLGKRLQSSDMPISEIEVIDDPYGVEENA